MSRPEVAQAFLSPAPERTVAQLLSAGRINGEQARLSRHVPMCDALCVEADSGGHTDQGVAATLIPAFVRLRDQYMARFRYPHTIAVGAAGGIGTPEAAAAAFILGADFVLTGSINQCTPEAGNSEPVKDLLEQMDVRDTAYAPAGDMFELGARIQVLKKGLLFPARANKLYALYRQCNALEALDDRTRDEIQDKYFRRSFDEVYQETCVYYAAHDPQQVARAERDPKHKMALVFRWYFVHSMRLALKGSMDQRVDYQVHCGPALGAFNRWVEGTDLQSWRSRHVDVIAERLMHATAALLSERLRSLVWRPTRSATARSGGARIREVDNGRHYQGNRRPEPPPYRVVAMDGGGIYGIFTAIMLRKLCERLPNFFDDDRVTLFAGTSAGAVNALLLAKHENPRDVITYRLLERTFRQDWPYANRLNPVTGVLSLFGLTSWSGRDDFYSGLEGHFGNMRMKDLKHRVLITAFDMWGERAGYAARSRRGAGSLGPQRWKPKVFYNFPEEEPDRELYVKDVAYGAASPPTVRPVVNGITDGGFFADDPSINAIAKIVSRAWEYKDPLVLRYQRICTAFLERARDAKPSDSSASERRMGLSHLLARAEQRNKVAYELGELEKVVRQRDSGWDKEPSQQVRALREQRKLLQSEEYAKGVVDAAREAYSSLLTELDLGRVWTRPQRAVGAREVRRTRSPKISEQTNENIAAVVRLVEWEIKFWRLLVDILDWAGFTTAFEREQVVRPKALLDELEKRHTNVGKLATGGGSKEEAEALLLRLGFERNALYQHLEPSVAEQSLKHISVLSLGVGAMTPHYFLQNFDFGILPFNLLATNFGSNFFESPLVTFTLNPDKEATTYEVKQLLGDEDYFRLDPSAIGYPVPSVIAAVYLARFPNWRAFLADRIYQVAESEGVGEQLEQAEKWIKDHDWA